MSIGALFRFTCVLALCGLARSQGTSSELGCFENLVLPSYPPLARQARIEGTVLVEFVANRNGDAEDIKFTKGHRLLQAAVERSIKTTKLLNRCVARKIRLEFEFRVTGTAVESGNPPLQITWLAPQTFKIVVPPLVPME